ncbi:hypothetical protein [Caulobacter sp. UC70_42]|uniref:hypothetical protein n=1 Tax=Caulobacter sp. UC70_42 TaxID=3374551 RepID=UPI00375757D1
MAEVLDVEAEKAKIEAQKTAGRWISELGLSEKALQPYIERAKKIVRRYKRDDEAVRATVSRNRQFALLWANTETIRPALYARPPQPVVSRRFKDADPVAKAASEVLERCLTFSIDKNNLDGVTRDLVLDYVLVARGITWERYVPTHGAMVYPKIPVVQITTDAGVKYNDDEGREYEEDDVTETDDGYEASGEGYEPVIFEESVTDYVNNEDWGCSPSRTWDEVTYVWRRVYMDREQLEDRFGEEIGSKVPLDWGPRTQDQAKGQDKDGVKRAAVYEIWDKCSKKVFWISKSWSAQPLDVRDDPLGLDGFFPCPKPLLGTTGNDSLIPVPDYVYWQDQAEEIDDLTSRIGKLEKALKLKGFYAGEGKTNLDQLFKNDTNMLIPVADWITMKEGGGLRGQIEWMPIEQVVTTLQACISLRSQLIEDVYQITGVADILRGATDPGETATAQRIKARTGAVRIRDRQNELARYLRDVLRIKGEVIAEKFGIDTWRAMTGEPLPTAEEKAQAQAQMQQAMQMAQATGQQPPPLPPGFEDMMKSPTWEDVQALLSNNAMRQFRIDIETDSTIEPNEMDEQERTVQFIQAISGFFAQVGPQVAAQPLLARMFGEMIKFAARRFRAGRQLEDIIDSTVDQITAAASQPPAQTPAEQPDTTPIAVAQINQQTEQMVQQGETERARIEQQTQLARLPIEQAETQIKGLALVRDNQPQVVA